MILSKIFGRALLLTVLLVALPAAVCAQEETEVIIDEETVVSVEEVRAIVETNLGTITLKLYPDLTPKTVENFVGLSEKGYYENVIFHRVIPKFMMQGGDPTGTGMGGRSLWGELAMANAGPGTNGSQFFITFAPTGWLTGKHTIFGEVVEGAEVLDAVENAPLGARDKPIEDIVIQKVTIERVVVE